MVLKSDEKRPINKELLELGLELGSLYKQMCVDQEEYKEHEKESVLYILYVSQYGVNCKGDFKLVTKSYVK